MYRRSLLSLLGTAALGGCTAAGPLADDPDHVVAGVEWKRLRAVRNERNRSLVTNQPEDVVEHRAPVDLDLRNHVFDDEVLDGTGASFPRDGSLVIDGDLLEALEAGYDELVHVAVYTMYEREDVAGVPLGNAYGYRMEREAFNRIDPGDRVVVTVEERGEVPWISELVDVTSA